MLKEHIICTFQIAPGTWDIYDEQKHEIIEQSGPTIRSLSHKKIKNQKVRVQRKTNNK